MRLRVIRSKKCREERNIIVMDIRRAIQETDGLDITVEQIIRAAERIEDPTLGSFMQQKLEEVLSVWQELSETDDRETIEATAKPLFRDFIRLYQMALMTEERDHKSRVWIGPAMDYMASTFENRIKVENPPDLETVHELIGWSY
jgi:hypothetical protein